MLQERQKIWTVDRSAALFCTPGAVKEKDGVRFTVAVERGQKAELLLYDKKSGALMQEEAFPGEAAIGGLRTMKVNALPWKQYTYQFRIDGETAGDPYATVLCPQKEEPESWEDIRCGMAFSPYDWKGDKKPGIAWEDAVMYHLHVRNFTRHSRSKVQSKGTFKGLQEKIPYLKELGVNQVKLMPVYEPAPQPCPKKGHPQMHMPAAGKNYWGYGAGNYFAPRRSFAAADPVKELKDCVRMFHENGMEVLLDMYFTPEVPVRMALDCLTFWVREYHIDGFHIMGKEDICRCLAGDALLAGTKLLSGNIAGWYSGSDRKTGKTERCFAECNDGFLVDMRRLLKGDEGVLDAAAWRSRRNSADFGIINYITNHDGFPLQDLVSYDSKHNEENGEQNNDGAVCNFSWNCGTEGPCRKRAVLALRRKQVRNAFLLVLLAQGTPMLLAGDEFGNSQGGNNNPYCLDNQVSWVDWSAYQKNRDLTEFVKKAVAFRREHKILRLPEEPQMTDYRSCGYPDLSYHSSRAWYGDFSYNSRQLGVMLCGSYAGDEEYLYIAYNFNPLPQEFALPKLPKGFLWHIAIDTAREDAFLAEPEPLNGPERIKEFPERTVVVLIGKKGRKKDESNRTLLHNHRTQASGDGALL